MSPSFRDLFFASKERTAVTVSALVAVVLAAFVGTYLLTEGQSYDFALNQKVSATAPLRLTFPEQMDRVSVEKEMTLPDGLDTEREWSDNSLILKPKQKLTTDAVYVVRVSENALKADGVPLGRELTYTFTVTGAPMISAQIPLKDAKDIDPGTDIVLVFDRPVVALTQTQGGASGDVFKNWPVTISPSPRGRWRWLGTTTATFEPEQPLVLATKYTVTVPAGIQTVSGDATEKDFTWSFETERPRVLETVPANMSKNAGPTTKVVVNFSHEMDLISAKASLHVMEVAPATPISTESGSRPAGKAMTITNVAYGTAEEPDGKKVTDKKVIVVSLSPLSFNKQYLVTVDAGIRGLKGDLGSAETFNASFSTVGDLTITHSEMREGYLQIDFSNPIDSEMLKKGLVFNPPVDMNGQEPQAYEICCDKTGYRLGLYLQFKPSTAYTVTLSKDFKDAYGQPLKKPFQLKFTTPELKPEAFLHPRGNQFGIFEKGKPPVYFLNQVNVSDMHVTLGEMTLDDLKTITLGKMNNYDRTIDVKSIDANAREWHIKPTSKKNEWEAAAFDIEKYAGKLKSGLYVVSYDAPEWKDYDLRPAQESRIFAITNMGVTLKYSGGKALVWVVDLQTGVPVQSAAVKLHALQSGKVVSGQTDAEGFFETRISIDDFKNRDYDYQPTFFATVEKAGDLAFVGSDWNNGFQPYDFDGVSTDFRSPNRASNRLQSTFYTERPLYKAGDAVHFKGIVRFLDWNGQYSVPDRAGRTVAVRVMDPENKEVYSKTLKLSEFGTFADSFTLAGEASLGYYYVTGKILPENDVEGEVYGNFSVLAYRKPEYKATVEAEKEDYFSGDTIKATVNGMYYFGAPMGGAKVNWRAMTTDYFFNKYTEDWYSFALEDNWCWYRCERGNSTLTEGTGVLDAAGRLTLSFPADIQDKGVGQIVGIEADLTDQNNQIVSARTETILHKSKVYVGLRSNDYAVQSGEESSLKLITLKTDGTPAPNVPVELKVFSRTWNVTRQKGVDGEYYYDNEPEDTYIRTIQARTDEAGKALTKLTLEGTGQFRIIATAKDEDGRESKAGWTMYLWNDTYYNWPRSNNDRVDVIADKPSYQVGDTAKLVVKSPYQGKGVKALVTVERENVMTKKVIDVLSNALPIEVPITEDMIPTSYVSVVIVKPRQGETFNENGLDTGSPAFKVGYVKLQIDTSKKKIAVNILTDKEKYAPGEKVTVKLEAFDSVGNPVRAELSLGVVDLSLLDLTGFEMPDLVARFYSERGLGVVTANMLTYLMERFKPGSKGGGGGGEERTRGNFQDTAYWNPRIVTDENGLATVSFTLPDNLTTWQLLALGSTKNNTFGGFAKTVIETKKVIVRPVRPRFAVVGDNIALGAIVHNYLDESRTFTVKLSGKGFTPGGQMEQRVTLEKNAQAKLTFPVKVSESATGVTLRFTATTEGAKDDIIETIPVYRFGVQQTVATFGTTETQVTEQIAVPTKKDASDGTVTVSLSPSAAVYLKDGLEYLAKYPYGCAEQTMSAIIPNVSLKQLQGFEQFKFVDDALLTENVSVGFQKIYSFQQSDGGFGYWQGGRSYPYLTAYILYGFKLAERAGYPIDRTVVSSAILFLRNAVRDSSRDYGMDDASRAFALYVLSEYESTDAALLNALYKARVDLPLHSKAHLAMALKKGKMDAKAMDVLEEIESVARIDSRGAHFEEIGNGNRYYESMNTDARTTAIVLQAMLRIDPENVLLPKIVRGMLSSRHDGHWDTTQSTAQSVLALVEFLKVTKELEFNFVSSVDVAGKKVLDAKFSDGKLLTHDIELAFSQLNAGKTAEVKVGKEGTGKLYYDVVMSYFYTPDVIQPAEEGIGIQRETTPLTKADASMKVGTTQKVRLTVTVPETRHFVAVESMLPGGYEPIDLQYATSQQNLLGNVANPDSGNWFDYYRNQTWRFGHIEYRDDRIFLFAEELPAGIYRYEYLVRLTTPGTFRERPASVWEMYYPENYGQTSGGWVKIGE